MDALQGHLRLLLLPIVYNAMAMKEELRQLPLFRALQRAMRASAYDRLLRHPPPGPPTPDKPRLLTYPNHCTHLTVEFIEYLLISRAT